MLRILNKKDFQGLTQVAILKDDRFYCDFFGESFFETGVWYEYWENEIINFKFHALYDIITIYSGWFSSQHQEKDLETFFKIAVKPEEILEFLDKEVTLEIKNSIPGGSDLITKVWKYDFKKYFYNVDPGDKFFKEHHEILLNNTKIIRGLPYNWGSGLKLYCPDKLDLDDKIYWFNLCLLKLYVTRWYKRSDKECK